MRNVSQPSTDSDAIRRSLVGASARQPFLPFVSLFVLIFVFSITNSPFVSFFAV